MYVWKKKGIPWKVKVIVMYVTDIYLINVIIEYNYFVIKCHDRLTI